MRNIINILFLLSYNEYKAKGERFIGGWLFHLPFLMTIEPDLVKSVLAKDFQHFVDRGVFYDEENDPLSAHLFSLTGLKWKHLRQKLTPTFTSGKLKQMFQTLVDCTSELETCLDDSVAKDEPILIKEMLMKYATNVIGSCAFGIDCNSFKNPNSEFMCVSKTIFQPTTVQRIKIFFAITLPDAAKFLKVKLTRNHVEYFFTKLVKDTIEYREKNNIVRNDFLHLLIQLKNKGIVENDDEGNVNRII